MNKNFPTVSIVIPIFNNPHLILSLWESLYENVKDNVFEIILADDCSDLHTQQVLRHLASYPKVILKESKKNQGFLGNCNSVFDECKGEIVVLLNSDTLIPINFLDRIVTPFLFDEHIALATPLSTNAANLSVILSEGQTWTELDYIFSQYTPLYPDACTAVGFCLAIRRSSVDSPLFDTVYGLGYGEETDLHYRILQKGFRSVIIDNMLVYHEGGATFGTVAGLDTKKNANIQTFLSRWGDQHTAALAKYEKLAPLSRMLDIKLHSSLKVEVDQSIDILFVLPCIKEAVGGVSVVWRLCEYLIRNGIKAQIYSYGPISSKFITSNNSIYPFTNLETLYKKVKAVGKVFATSHDSVKITRELSSRFSCPMAYFIQGPESLFQSGTIAHGVVKDYEDKNIELFVVSSFLKQYVHALTQREDIHELNFGADSDVFYSKAYAREPKSIAGCLRSTTEKSSALLIHFLQNAKKNGFTIHLFGKESSAFDLPEDFAIFHGNLPPRKIAELFNRVEFYADFSLFEGLGLLPLEAAACGAIPIISNNGGGNFIFENNKNALFIDNHFFYDSIISRVKMLSDEQKKSLMENALVVSDTISFKNGLSSFLKHNDSIDKGRNTSRSRGSLQPNWSTRSDFLLFLMRKFIKAARVTSFKNAVRLTVIYVAERVLIRLRG